MLPAAAITRRACLRRRVHSRRQMSCARGRLKGEEADCQAGLCAKRDRHAILWDSLSVHTSKPVKGCLASHKGEIFAGAYPGAGLFSTQRRHVERGRGLAVMGQYDYPRLRRTAPVEKLRTGHFPINAKEYLCQKVSAVAFWRRHRRYSSPACPCRTPRASSASSSFRRGQPAAAPCAPPRRSSGAPQADFPRRAVAPVPRDGGGASPADARRAGPSHLVLSPTLSAISCSAGPLCGALRPSIFGRSCRPSPRATAEASGVADQEACRRPPGTRYRRIQAPRRRQVIRKHADGRLGRSRSRNRAGASR